MASIPAMSGNLVAGLPGSRACTPAGILELLKRYRIPIAGQARRGGGPQRHRRQAGGAAAAPRARHRHDLPFPDGRSAAVCREADILVAAMGRAAMITGEYIREGATVIDVGTNRLDSREDVARIFRNSEEKLASYDKKGSVLVGDVDPLDVVEKASAYTPVPGGVGPLTIAMLMVNTVASAERRVGIC
jgi:methylenetetrahydrofolate dehydrogenase (NADP+)/methenyltetrahydrofolate cyclohydrolase